MMKKIGSAEPIISLGELNIISKIVHESNGWNVYSEKGKHLGGPYKDKGSAVKRLREIEYFRHKK